ncbi:MAG: nucleoside deaminase [Deltaproteobacteria bacterium]|nr:MAG: nucleoside deaminase [Deltaproteobacteria bacterium]
MTLQNLEHRLAHIFAQDTHHKDQEFGLMACEEALAAARIGNYGVGAILVSPTGQVIERGQNQAFYPIFRSDLHAEMVVMNSFEQNFPKVDSMRGYTLICSLEPCPMCVFRLLISGVQTVKFLARDELGGMVAHMRHLPTAGKHLAERQEFVLADVSEELRQFALDIFLLNLEHLRQKLWSR